MSVVGCLLEGMSGVQRHEQTGPEQAGRDGGTLFEGWCPDCGIQSAIIEVDAAGNGWATCTECEVGWVHRDDRGAELDIEPSGWRAAA
jgi:hypothetical protein